MLFLGRQRLQDQTVSNGSSTPESSCPETLPADLQEIRALLSMLGLPDDGVAERLDGFLIARDPSGHLIGTIGLERHGKIGLLRSAAVCPEVQGLGLGRKLVAAILEIAVAESCEEVVLLTLTARDFFGKHFGFVEVSRSSYTETLGHSTEFNLPCCSTAVVMKLNR